MQKIKEEYLEMTTKHLLKLQEEYANLLNDIDNGHIKIHDCISRLVSLRNEIERLTPFKWEPKGGSYHVSCYDHVHSTNDISESATNFGSRFETREAAEKASKVYRKFHRLYKLAEELNEGWIPNWDDDLQPKFAIAQRKGKYLCNQINIIEFIDHIYFKSEEAAEKAIKILEQEE
jgi:hypothetical protein